MEVGLHNKLENIQFLRFIAAFSVMMVHLPSVGFGIWGVDIFFVISGFVMMYITEKENNLFFLKRLIRVVPLYWIATSVIFLIALIKPDYLISTTANFEYLLKSLFFIPFNKNELGHFPILSLGWTLNYEIIFYALFSLSLIFFKDKKVLFVSSMIILFIIINNFLSGKNFIFWVYSNLIFLEFIFGMVVYKIWYRYFNKFKINLRNKIILIMIALILTFYLNSHGFEVLFLADLESSRIIRFGIPSFFLIFIFLFFLSDIKFPKIFIILGDASYCIYLIHPFLIKFFYNVFSINQYNFTIQIISQIFIVFFILWLSIMIFLFIETPISKKLKKSFKLK